jgi:hypothetical protein
VTLYNVDVANREREGVSVRGEDSVVRRSKDGGCRQGYKRSSVFVRKK